MARKNSSPSADSSRSRSAPSGQRFLVILALIILVLFLLKRMGVPIVWRSESTEIIEHPHR